MKNYSEPLVSVITVTYNARPILEKTINSVHGQSLRSVMEYLVIDGNSTDGTQDIIHRQEAQIDRWISEPDTGIYDAMNKAVTMARGEWIIFMNAGDVFADERVVEDMALSGRTADLVYGDCIQIYPQGFSVLNRAGNPQDLPRKMICSHQSLAVRRGLLQEYPFDPEYSICADYHFLLRCYGSGRNFERIDRTVGVVQLEQYTWSQISRGIRQKQRASKSVLNAPGTDFWFHRLWLIQGIKHLVKKVLPLSWFKGSR